MSLSKDEQEEYYHQYWSKIEKLTDGEPTMFIRDYLTIKNGTISKVEELYFDFKLFYEEKHLNRKNLLADMLKFADYYRKICKGETGNKKLDRKLKQIATIDTTVHLPFLLSFFDYATEKGLEEMEIYTVLDIVENYWARRIICGYPANSMLKLFSMLHSDIMRIFKRHEERGIPVSVPYSQVMTYVLLHKQGTSTFPSNREVSEEFETRQIYRIPSSYKLFLFERMENENSPEADDMIVEKMKEGRVTIEHIMPQTLTPQWKHDLGEQWEEIHEKYLHTFANLTLTGFNVSYSNHSFQEKKEGYIDRKGNKVDGFDNSAFRLSNFIKHCNKWTLEEIQLREKVLLENFLHLWPMITTKYQPLEKEYELVSFNDDEYELKGRTIIGFRYRNERHAITTWKEMLVQVCKLLYQENPSSMIYMATKNNNLHEENAEDRSKIADNCYVYSSCSTNTKRGILTNLFKGCNIPAAVLEFELVPITENIIENEEL